VLSRGARGVWLAVPLLVAVAACGSDEQDPASSTPTTATATRPATQPTGPEGIDTLAGAGTKPVIAAARNQRTALLTDVRAARHEGDDRVVFEFAQSLPGYDVRYVQRPVRQDGSGKAVDVAGTYVAVVRMENALDADLTKPSAPRTYTGPLRISPGMPEIAELVRTGGFEGVLTWAVGVRDRVDFRVTTLTSPPRVIVDFRNH
jgi:hypothetical protein